MALDNNISEEIFQLLFEGTHDAVAIHDKDGRYLDVNPAFCKDLGLSREELLNLSVQDIHPDDHLNELLRQREVVFREGFAEYTCAHAYGSSKPVPVTTRAYRIHFNGQPAILTLCKNQTALKDSQSALLEALSLQSNVVESIPIGIWVADRNFRVQLVNAATEEIFGVRADELLQKNIFDQFPSLVESGLKSAYQRVMETGEPLDLKEVDFRDPSLKQQHYFLNIRANALRDDEESITGIVVLIEDVTEAMLAEQRLRSLQSEHRQLDEIIQHSPVIAFRWRYAEGWPIDYVSQNIRTELGYDPNLLLAEGKRFEELVHPDDRDRVRGEVQAHLEQGDAEFTQTYRVLSRSGGVHWIDDRTWLRRGPHGQITHVFGVLVDITDRRTMEQALVAANENLATANEELSTTNEELLSEIAERTRMEQALRESEQRFRAVFEASRDCILVWDRDYNYVYANQAAIDHVGARPENVIGRTMRDGLGHIPDFMHTWMARVDEVFRTGQPMRVEDRSEIDDRKIYSESVLFPIEDAAGEMVYVGAIYRDITERKQAELHIRRQARHDAAFSSLLHELLKTDSLQTISQAVLDQACALTDSTIGYAGYIETQTGFLVCPTMTGNVWDHCEVPGKSMVFEKFTGLWGWSLNQRQALRTNDPAGDERSSGTPMGHIPIHRFLAAPALAGETLVGQIALANATRDYTEEDQALVERLAAIYAIAVQRYFDRQSLQDRERLLNETQSLARTGGWELDAETLQVSWTDQVGAIHDLPPGSSPNLRDALEYYAPHHRPIIRQAVENALANGTPFDLELQFRSAKGRDLWVRAIGDPVRKDDKIVKLRGLFQDITERKQNELQREEALAKAQRSSRESHALLQAAQAVMGSETFEKACRTIFDIAEDVTGATSGYVALLSDDGEENELRILDAGGRPCSVNPELPMPVRGLRAEAYRNKQAVYDNQFAESEWMQFMPEGHVRLDNVLFAPLVVGGRAVGLIGLANKPEPFTDEDAHIAQRMGEMAAIALINARNRENLQASEARYRSVFESSSDAMFLMSDVVLDCNEAACRLCRCPREQILGRSPEAFSPPTQPDGRDSAAASREYVRRALEGEPQQFVWMHRNAAGEDLECEVALSAVTVDAQQRALVSLRDISQRRRAEQERRQFEAKIQHAQKLESLGVLAGGIAHDFNNLLTSILGNTELAGMEIPPASPVKSFLDEIKNASIHASELCNQMLAYSGKGKLVVHALDLNELVGEMVHLLRTSISKKVQLDFDFHERLQAVEGDPTQLRQVVMNLITNASDAIDDQAGTITVRTRMLNLTEKLQAGMYLQEPLQPGPYVAVSVADTGCGMDEETLGKLFDPFFTTKFTGRGLGLAAVLGIVRGHHGSIRIDTEPGKGSTFEILLPASRQPLPEPTPEPDTQEAWTGEGTVLVADDEEGVRTLATRMLRKLGFEVLTASDGQEALEVFDEQNGNIRLVLLDMTMPRLNGEEVFRQLRQRKADLPVVLASGYTQQDATSRFTEDGLGGFIQKPYRFEDLRQTLREVLAG